MRARSPTFIVAAIALSAGLTVRCWATPIVSRANWKHQGIGKGDKVLIWGENCAEWVAAFFGCLLRGVVVVPIDKIAAPDFAVRIAEQVDARLCVGSPHNQIAGRDVASPGNAARAVSRSTRCARHSAAARLATTSCRSFSPRAQLPNLAASSFRTATFSPTWRRSNTKSANTCATSASFTRFAF